jgi:hypothetical protein
MNPIDDLDAVLSGGLAPAQADDSLAPLIAASARLQPLAAAEPSPAFASALQARILAHAARQARESVREGAEIEWDEDQTVSLPAVPQPNTADHKAIDHPGNVRRLPWRGAAIAAAFVVLSVCIFGFLRLEQGNSTNSTSSLVASARSHLQKATQALDQFDQAFANHDDAAISNALGSLNTELQATSSSIEDLPQGATQTSLQQQLQSLKLRVQNDLRAQLSQLSWPERVDATLALGAAGDSVPTIAQAEVQRDDNQSWEVTLTGANFIAGAVLYVDGRREGPIDSLVGSTQISAHFSSSSTPQTIGIGEPDGTAAQANAALSSGTPRATPTGTATGLIDLHGRITSIDQAAGTFVLSLSTGSTLTIVVNAQTRFTGQATSLSALKTGMLATIKGTYQTGGTFLAAVVQAPLDE